jgi:hypothetical protein
MIPGGNPAPGGAPALMPYSAYGANHFDHSAFGIKGCGPMGCGDGRAPNYGGLFRRMNGAGGCDDGCGNCGDCGSRCPDGPCPPYGTIWVSAEYLLYWATGYSVPPLVTSAPDGTARNVAGTLANPNTTILFGNRAIGTDTRSGFRVRTGFWLDECQTIGIDGSFAFLGGYETNYFADCATAGQLFRPFFNARPDVNRQDVELVCFPNVLTGSVNVNATGNFYTADANVRINLCCDCWYRTDLLIGYRFVSTNERLVITEDLTDIDPNNQVPDNTRIIVQDSFRTTNRFHGAQIGVTGEIRRGIGFLDYRALVGLGPNSRTVQIDGSTSATPPGGATATNVGGLLAQRTNIGTYDSTVFSVIPELNLNAGVMLGDHVRAWVGYGFLYWSNMVRPGPQIDTTVNSTQIPPGVLVGPARPRFRVAESDMWIHGLNFGLQVRY